MKFPVLHFGHPTRVVLFWRRLTAAALRQSSTPFYVFSTEPVCAALAELASLQRGVAVPVIHWLSCKTQPVAPLLAWWRRQGRPIEVVSEFEFLAARAEGFAPGQILVNGPAKQRWLPRHASARLRVNFDSWSEARALLPLARQLDWSAGLRLHTREEFDPEHPECPTQFGFSADEALEAIRRLRRAGVRLETVHFHLRTNLASPRIIERAIREVAALCHAAQFAPRHLDIGGGLPPPHVLDRAGRRLDAQFRLRDFAGVLTRAVARFPGLQEIWCENGRFLSARAGVLVTRVLEAKERGGLRQLICDAGRTTSALVSTWEAHELLSFPRRRGPAVPTVVCGPTCMAFDQLARRPLPRALRAGDHLAWMDAGAYHIPWETRFSHGAAGVFWHEAGTLTRVRSHESFEQWWGPWRAGSTGMPHLDQTGHVPKHV